MYGKLNKTDNFPKKSNKEGGDADCHICMYRERWNKMGNILQTFNRTENYAAMKMKHLLDTITVTLWDPGPFQSIVEHDSSSFFFFLARQRSLR